MGRDQDNVLASIAHLALCYLGGQGISQVQDKSFIYPGLHANLFVHGVLGFLHYQSSVFNNDFEAAYALSYKASRYLALPCLMADITYGNQTMSTIHLVSGLVPFVLALVGTDNTYLGNLMVLCNIISLCHYSMENDQEWGWYAAAAGLFAYFLTPQLPVKMVYPLGLATMQYCAYKLFHEYCAGRAPGCN